MAAPTSELPFTLYFPGPDGLLHGEVRTFEVPAEPAARARAVISGLLAGPRDSELFAPFPSRVELGNALLPANGTLYLDLRADGAPPGMGSTDELLTVYSLVDTVAWSVPEVRRVVLLWNGVQLETLGGHVDTASPLEPSKALVAGSTPAPEASAASAAAGTTTGERP